MRPTTGTPLLRGEQEAEGQHGGTVYGHFDAPDGQGGHVYQVLAQSSPLANLQHGEQDNQQDRQQRRGIAIAGVRTHVGDTPLAMA